MKKKISQHAQMKSKQRHKHEASTGNCVDKKTNESHSNKSIFNKEDTCLEESYSKYFEIEQKLLLGIKQPQKATRKMATNSERRSAFMRMLFQVILIIHLILFLLLNKCPAVTANGASNILKSKQYNLIYSSSPPSQVAANNLVNTQLHTTANNQTNFRHKPQQMPSIATQSLPLMRQQRQVTDVEDDVIESSTVYNSAQLFQGSQLRPYALQAQQQQQQQAASACQLPPTWVGKWYQANKDQIRVTNTMISDKGICRDKKGDKYLFEYSRPSIPSLSQVGSPESRKQQQQQQQSCLICLVINERHLNVLQYKESSCQPIPASYLNRTNNLQQLDLDDHSLLDTVCSDITGDAQLESLFRLDTPPIECPISGKFNFTYDNCRDPHSSLDSCLDKKQLNFKFAACPDVPGSESKTEQLKCYADWSEGNNYYMIGRLNSASNRADVGKFRCFVYEKSPDSEGYIPMAQSLEESCYGLINAYEGPKTLRLKPRQPTNLNKCQFPGYIWSQSENWLSVDNSLIYMFNQNSTKYQVKETREGNVIEEAACLQQFFVSNSQQAALQQQQPVSGILQQLQQANNKRFPPSIGTSAFNQDHAQATTAAARSTPAQSYTIYLIQITKNCQTTDYCARFHRRTSGIVQIDYFVAVPGADVSQRCKNAFIAAPQTQIITSTNLETQRCPFEGAYTIEAPSESDLSFNPSNIFICPRQSFLTAQCEQPNRMRIHYKCSSQNAAIQMPAKHMVKNFYCLGSWTSNGLVRLLLADDERQRYSAWFRDYGPPTLTATAVGEESTRSQHLLAFAQQQQQPPVGSIVDLQIALITPMSTKPMQARLTRRNQCSDIKNYLVASQASSSAWFGYGQSSNLPLSSIPSSGYASFVSPSSSARSPVGTLNVVNSIFVIFVTLLMFRITIPSLAN